jgi:hypothetical protein
MAAARKIGAAHRVLSPVLGGIQLVGAIALCLILS